jgi:hypothetical protein
MRKLFISLLLLVVSSSASAAGPIGTLGMTDYLSIAGMNFMNVASKLIILTSVISGAANCTYRKWNGAAGYQVTAGKTLKLLGIRFINPTDAAQALIIEQSDNDVGYDSATALTGAVSVFGWTGQTFYPGAAIADQKPPYGEMLMVGLSVAASKYLTIRRTSGGTTRTVVFGYEE